MDNGVASIRSASFVADKNWPTAISLSYAFAHDNRATQDDFLRVWLVGPDKRELILEELGALVMNPAVWKTHLTSLDGFKGQEVYILIEVADNQQDSLIEAALDDIFIYYERILPLGTPTPIPRRPELWKSDGTAPGTQLVKDTSDHIENCHLGPQNYILFTVYDATHGRELWISDGSTSKTVLLKDIFPGEKGSDPRNFTTVNDTVFFGAIDDSTSIRKLWKTDGNAAGTVKVSDIDPSHMAELNGVLIFSGRDLEKNQELWKSDGTQAGTILIKTIQKVRSHNKIQNHMFESGGLIYFLVNAINGTELWRSDGTQAGTSLIKTIQPNEYDYPKTENMIAIGDTLFFTSAYSKKSFLWKSKGTHQTTRMITDVYFAKSKHIHRPIAVLDDAIFFQADDCDHGNEMWKHDLANAKTSLVQEIHPGSTDSVANIIGSKANQVLFLAYSSSESTNMLDLWKTDGTSIGTVLIKQALSIKPEAVQMCGAFGDTLYFLTDSN